MTLLLATGFLLMEWAPWGRAILVAVWLFHIWLFWVKIPTGVEEDVCPEEPEAE